MLTLKVLSVLLSYPKKNTYTALKERAQVVESEDVLGAPQKVAVLNFIATLRKADLIDWQERYVATFDQGQSLSLHMFEHVHGESRVRGQAMVDLLEFYRGHGFEVAVSELPDYLPLYLEFVACQSPAEARKLLKEIVPVVSLLRARLRERRSAWHVVFDALADIAGEDAALIVQELPVLPGSNVLSEDIDRQWAEEPQNFVQAGCPSSSCQSCKVAVSGCKRSSPTGEELSDE